MYINASMRGSRMSREVPVRFCEGLRLKCLGLLTFNAGALTNGTELSVPLEMRGGVSTPCYGGPPSFGGWEWCADCSEPTDGFLLQKRAGDLMDIERPGRQPQRVVSFGR